LNIETLIGKMKKDPTKDEIRDIFKEKDSKRGDIIKNPTL